MTEATFKYSKATPEQVRWYWYRNPVTKGRQYADILSRGELLRFCDSDSLALEKFYSAHESAIERAWWKEQAKLYKGPSGLSPDAASIRGQPGSSWEDFFSKDRLEDVGVPVRGGLYEVDVYQRRMQPCYWPGDVHAVVRGLWFVERGSDWLPLRENLSDQLEEAYKGAIWDPTFKHATQQPEGMLAARIELMTTDMQGLYALFVSSQEMYVCNEDAFSWFRKLGGGGTGARLRRGYVATTGSALAAEADVKQEEHDEYCANTPVSSLVLFVHGIGQSLGAANIAMDVTSLRTLARQLAVETLSDGIRAGSRVEFLPVQWRKQLTLDVDRLASLIQLPGIKAVRQIAHATGVEVLLYMSHVHRQNLIDSLVDSANTLYTKFLQRNTQFKGTVSLVGHSLGSVLLYDILVHQKMPSYPDALNPFASQQQGHGQLQPEMAAEDKAESGVQEHAQKPETLWEVDGHTRPASEHKPQAEVAAELQFDMEPHETENKAPAMTHPNAGKQRRVLSLREAVGEAIKKSRGLSGISEEGGRGGGRSPSTSGPSSSPAASSPSRSPRPPPSTQPLPTSWAGPNGIGSLREYHAQDSIQDEASFPTSHTSPTTPPSPIIMDLTSTTPLPAPHSSASPPASPILGATNAPAVQPPNATATPFMLASGSDGPIAALVSPDGTARAPFELDDTPGAEASLGHYLPPGSFPAGDADSTAQSPDAPARETAAQISPTATDDNRDACDVAVVPASLTWTTDPAETPRETALIAAEEADEDASTSAEVAALQAENRSLMKRLDAMTAECERLTRLFKGGQSSGTSLAGDVTPPRSPGASLEEQEAVDYYHNLRVKKLKFDVDKFIMMGSPMGLFLVLHGINPGAGVLLGGARAAALSTRMGITTDGLPAANRWYNLYHPFDPVAYRIEPLVVVGGENLRPCFVPHKGGTRTHIALQELREDVSARIGVAGRWSASVLAAMSINRMAAAGKVEGGKATQALPDAADGDASSPELMEVPGVGGTSGVGGSTVDSPLMLSPLADGSSGASNPFVESAETSVWRLTDGQAGSWERGRAQGRLDFVLQEAMTENQYISAMSAHFQYWTNPDVALFVLRAAYGLDVLMRWGGEKAEQERKEKEAAKKLMAESSRRPIVPEETISPRRLVQHLDKMPTDVVLTDDVVAFLET